MKARIVLQVEPDHWAPRGKVHYPKRCVLCAVQRLGLRLGLIESEED